MTEQQMISMLSKLEERVDRTYSWVKEISSKFDTLNSEFAKTREAIAAFKGRVNVIIAIAATMATSFFAVAVKLLFP